MDPPPADLQMPSTEPRSVEQSLASFVIEEGFEVQVVAAEPLIEDPVAAAWDADGRLWVCEMLGYMPDAEATGELEPSGNIVILEDTDHDGTMDKRTEFLSGIVLPRAIAFTKGGILYADQQQLFFVAINADGSAGRWQVIHEHYAGQSFTDGNVEHKANGLLYGLDNWYYSAKSHERYARVGPRFMRKPTEFRGQWGITQDDYGRLLANGNSTFMEYETLPPNASLRNPNINFNAGNTWARGSRLSVNNAVYPIRVTPGVNRGYDTSVVDHETWKLKKATAASGPVIYRADNYPPEYYNNVFIPEPAGHLLKRVILEDNGTDRPTARQAYENKEFLASDDERCRFVNTYVGPDGCLYVLDMYRGVIQHKTYVTTFLRRQIEERQLEKPIGMGRIYRIVRKDNPPDHTPPALGSMPSEELVGQLAHANAWYRETSQRLLVERNDNAAVKGLREMAIGHENPLARIHALWTLQGMRDLDGPTLLAAGQTDDPKVQMQVLRLAESFAGKEEVAPLIALATQYANAPSYEMDLQLALSVGMLADVDHPEAYDVLLAVLSRHADDRLFRHAVISGLEGKEAAMLARMDQSDDALATLTEDLTAAMVKATDNGTQTIGSLLELIDSERYADQPEQRLEMLNNLARQSIEQDREDVLELLIQRMSAQDAPLDEQRAILTGITEANKPGNQPVDLAGEPELFARWADAPPEGLEALVTKLDETFIYEKVVISDDMAEQIQRGMMVFAAQCVSCHQADGQMVPTQGPPLAGSDWVHGNQRMLSALMLNGAGGPIVVSGTLYSTTTDPSIAASMPAFGPALNDQEIADVLTFIRNSFGNRAPAVDPAVVAEMRAIVAPRNGKPFTPAELKRIEPGADEIVAVFHTPEQDLVNAGWLDRKSFGMVVLMVAVLVPLILLLLFTAMINRKSS